MQRRPSLLLSHRSDDLLEHQGAVALGSEQHVVRGDGLPAHLPSDVTAPPPPHPPRDRRAMSLPRPCSPARDIRATSPVRERQSVAVDHETRHLHLRQRHQAKASDQPLPLPLHLFRLRRLATIAGKILRLLLSD